MARGSFIEAVQMGSRQREQDFVQRSIADHAIGDQVADARNEGGNKQYAVLTRPWAHQKLASSAARRKACTG